MKLTPEQISIVNSTGNIKINAVAGSGKTTTLIEYAKAKKNSGRILYLAFNKSVKIEAEKKFAEAGVTNVQIETAHSLAFRYIVKGSGYKVKKEGSYRTAEIVEILGLNGYAEKNLGYVLANHINKFTTWFCASSCACGTSLVRLQPTSPAFPRWYEAKSVRRWASRTRRAEPGKNSKTPFCTPNTARCAIGR